MTNRLVKQGVTTYAPAVREVIARPAHCTTVTTRELVTTWKMTYVNNGRSWYWYTTPITKYEDVTRSVCYPEVQGVEGRDSVINYDNQPGWNASAHSAARVYDDLAAEFTLVPGSVGILCGLCPGAAHSFAAITHGVYYAEGGIFIVERGELVEECPEVDVPVRIFRQGDTVTYRVGDWSYTSEAPSRGAVNLAALLYVAGDSVDTPSIVRAAFLRAESAWGWANPSEGGHLRSRSAWGWGGWAAVNDSYASMAFAVDGFGADHEYSYARVDLGDFTLEAESGFPEVEAAGVVTSIPMTMAAGGVSIGVGTVDDYIDITARAYDHDYGTASGEVADLTCFALERVGPTDAGDYTEAIAFLDSYATDPVLFGHITSSIQAGFTLDVLLAIDGQFADYLVLPDDADATLLLQALISSGVTMADDPSTVARTLVQYATNAETGVATRYQGFDFQGFASTPSATFGWKRDGVYRLGAQSDDGELISAMVEFAAEDFGTAAGKRVSNLFMGLSTDGQVFARLLDDTGDEVVYRARQRTSEYRTDTQQGRSSRYWRLRLDLVDATFAELDNIEWVVGVTGRRTTR